MILYSFTREYYGINFFLRLPSPSNPTSSHVTQSLFGYDADEWFRGQRGDDDARASTHFFARNFKS